jgi:signal transduction histidine kinase
MEIRNSFLTHFDPRDFDVRDLVNAAIEAATPQARNKQLKLTRSVEPAIPHRLQGDAARGEVCVCVELEHENAAEVTVRFQVRDTSAGITAQTLCEFFERFSVAGDAAVADLPMGLTRCKDLVDSIGAAISVDVGGEGSSFHFVVRLPKGGGSYLPGSQTLH